MHSKLLLLCCRGYFKTTTFVRARKNCSKYCMGAKFFFLALRATSVIFWRYTPKPEFQKKFALLTEILKNLKKFIIYSMSTWYDFFQGGGGGGKNRFKSQ